MDGRIIERLKKRVGTRNDEEINELALACVKELENTGVYGDPATDALYLSGNGSVLQSKFRI